jgi:hypothetical protein
VYADGRVIWQQEADRPFGANPRSTGYLEQRLTPMGVELMRSEAISTGLFDENRDLLTDTGYGLCGLVDVTSGDRLVRVSFGCFVESGHPQPATQEEAQALLRLAARLSDPATWLPASAWEDQEIRPYVPSRFAICYSAGAAGHPAGATRILAALPGEAAGLLRGKDRTPESGDHCSEVSTEEARALAGVFEEAGYAGDEVTRTSVLSYVFEASHPLNEVIIEFEPIFPHGDWTCSACG